MDGFVLINICILINMLMSHHKPIKYAFTEHWNPSVAGSPSNGIRQASFASCKVALALSLSLHAFRNDALSRENCAHETAFAATSVSIPCLAGKSSRNAADFCPAIFVANCPWNSAYTQAFGAFTCRVPGRLSKWTTHFSIFESWKTNPKITICRKIRFVARVQQCSNFVFWNQSDYLTDSYRKPPFVL